tara:strand:- start:1427 stop:2089 length:663 start_codon:yes stop_codon:yes gene_type:complete
MHPSSDTLTSNDFDKFMSNVGSNLNSFFHVSEILGCIFGKNVPGDLSENIMEAFEAAEEQTKEVRKKVTDTTTFIQETASNTSQGLALTITTNAKLINTLSETEKNNKSIIQTSTCAIYNLKATINQLEREIIKLTEQIKPKYSNEQIDDLIVRGKDMANAYQEISLMLKDSQEETLVWKSRFTTLFTHVNATQNSSENKLKTKNPDTDKKELSNDSFDL